jgi:taurine--2-oxoglutarate transaminase
MENRILEFAKHSYGTWTKQKAWKSPMLITDAEGVYMYDHTGKSYIDFSSQLMCSNLGHKNKAIMEAVARQAEKLPYVAPGFTTEASIEAVEALRTIMPESLSKYFFCTSGTEANEAAIKMIRQYKAPAYKIISRYHSYHGATTGSAACTGDPRRWFAEQARCVGQGVRFAPDCYCYRCPFSLTYPDCNVQCARYLDYMIKEEGNIAAIITEPVVGTNGRLVPPPEYFPILRKICDENGVLLIADEVMTGWFRTGRTFAMEHWNVMPDIMTTAKGCTAAYTPLGITATSQKLADFFEEETLNQGHTYALHPLSMSAIPAAVSEYKKLLKTGLMERGAAHLRKKLFELADRHESIGDVRGIGHFWAFELVKNRETKAPFNVKADKFGTNPVMTAKVSADAMKNGLYVSAWYDTLVIAPPLIITEEQIDEALSMLDKSLEIADKEAESTGVPASRSSEF